MRVTGLAVTPPGAQTQLWAGRYAQCGILFERAIERGELPAQHTDARSLLIAATAAVAVVAAAAGAFSAGQGGSV